MKYVFISQPMNKRTDNEISIERNEIYEYAKNKYGIDVQIIDSFFIGAPYMKKPLWFLGKSIQLLADAEVVIMAPNWDKARGCRIEHDAAVEYGIEVDYYG